MNDIAADTNLPAPWGRLNPPQLLQQLPNRAKFQTVFDERHAQLGLDLVVAATPVAHQLERYGFFLENLIRTIVRSCFVCRLCLHTSFKRVDTTTPDDMIICGMTPNDNVIYELPPDDNVIYECLGCTNIFTDPCRFSERFDHTTAAREKIETYFETIKAALDR